MRDDDHPILFVPGPVEVEPELREILSMPAIGHRSSAAKQCAIDLCAGLKPLFRTAHHAFFENAPGTALMEAAIRNLVRDHVLHLSCGAFGERWHKISAACGRTPDVLAVEWGAAVTPEQLREKLTRSRVRHDAICITHNETSTGVLNPLAELCAVAREHAPDALLLVDAVTSLAGAPLEFDAWGIDVAFAGTQKCLALPPGLVVFAVSPRAVARASTIAGRGWWLDLAAAPERFADGSPPATPCVPLMFALRRQLERIAAEGLEARFRRHRAMRDVTLAWAERHAIEPLVRDAGHRSPTVTTLEVGARDQKALIASAKAGGFTIGGGYGKLKDGTFRIGHMGDHDVARVERLLAAILA